MVWLWIPGVTPEWITINKRLLTFPFLLHIKFALRVKWRRSSNPGVPGIPCILPYSLWKRQINHIFPFWQRTVMARLILSLLAVWTALTSTAFAQCKCMNTMSSISLLLISLPSLEWKRQTRYYRIRYVDFLLIYPCYIYWMICSDKQWAACQQKKKT